MNLNKKLWFLNLAFLGVMIAGIVILFTKVTDHAEVIAVMIGVPLAAYSAEMSLYSHAVAKMFRGIKNKVDKIKGGK